MDTQTKKLKIGIYNPYFDSLGGGERYVLTLAEHWSKQHHVSLFWDDKTIVNKAVERFGLDLQSVHVVPNVFARRLLVRKLIESSSYDLIFFLSDGSVPTTLARHNIIHFQVPFSAIPMTTWKAKKYDGVVVNSEFTKNNIDKNLSLPITVIYPPVEISVDEKIKKEKVIMSVGRFNALYGAKKQDVLIRVFIRMTKNKKYAGWKLVLAGGCLPTDMEYVQKLQKMAEGNNIEFQINCSYAMLKSLYAKASIYWHAAGYGETDPVRMEHFGMTTVEAMGSGCVPIVYNAGGQPEIVTDGINGYLWNTTDELIKRTSEVMKNDAGVKKLRTNALEASMKFSKEAFNRQYDVLLHSICK